MKKFVNKPEDFVKEMIEGLALANPDTLKSVPEYNIVYRADMPRNDGPHHSRFRERSRAGTLCWSERYNGCERPGNVFSAPPMEYVLNVLNS